MKHENMAIFDPAPLLDAVCGDIATIKELLGEFVVEIRENVVQLCDSLESGKQDLIFQAAHKTKGGSAAIGAKRLAEFCREIEEAARVEQYKFKPEDQIQATEEVEVFLDKVNRFDWDSL